MASVPCWPSVEAVPGAVDLAVIAVPEPAVLGGDRRLRSKGRVLAGDHHGRVRRDRGTRRRDAGDAQDARPISTACGWSGPTASGSINTDPAVSMNATFAAQAPLAGRVGFASQSGGLGIAILAEATARGLGLSSFVSMGNKADVSGNDLSAVVGGRRRHRCDLAVPRVLREPTEVQPDRRAG